MFLCWLSHSSADQELQARHDNRAVPAHVCAASAWQHNLCGQYLCEVSMSLSFFWAAWYITRLLGKMNAERCSLLFFFSHSHLALYAR